MPNTKAEQRERRAAKAAIRRFYTRVTGRVPTPKQFARARRVLIEFCESRKDGS